ncbi:hypothetical protein N7492_002015 [Penicillium capsulatum]|uniref:Uncharacterized protein n=1 Tax=Penicillium capsulatum TaxID=69766 RepID=A0A9W9IHT3_9EURO|nr:hypothetical protein N7492_002015 [Penicillium capsulatum]KAJ6123366.1 hypothetical protein N7512_005831 [Penicillium capsulatum]
MADEPPERYELRKSLMMLNWNLNADDMQQRFDFSLLEKHNVHVQHMSLDKGSADSPRFFAPYANAPPVPDEILKKARNEPRGFLVPGYYDDYARWFYGLWHRYTYDEMYYPSLYPQHEHWPWVQGCLLCNGLPRVPNCEESSSPEEVLRSADRYMPHVKAAIVVNAEAKDGELLRAEIMSVLRLMIHQMRQKRLIPHMKIPAMVLSMLGNRARLIEAFCEDGMIILRVTKLYDIPKDMAVASQQFAEWYEGTPTGDTKSR